MLTGPLPRITGRTVVMPQLLRAELGRIRANGYATESEETRTGYLSVAAPLYDADGLCAALSVTAPTFRVQFRLLVPAVQTAAASISARLRAGRALA